MLVLSRKSNERIRIGDQITVIVARISEDKVRLAIEAPPDVPVYREEVWQRIREQAATTGRDSGAEEHA